MLAEERLGYVRLDVCEDCWTNTSVQQETPSISHWQSVYAAPAEAPPEPIQKENAEKLLRRLVALHDPAHHECCYILAAMLERKRILKVKEQLWKDGQRAFLYEHPATGDLFTIIDPELQLNQLEQVQRDVASLLERGVVEVAGGPSETEIPSRADETLASAVVDSPLEHLPQVHPNCFEESSSSGSEVSPSEMVTTISST